MKSLPACFFLLNCLISLSLQDGANEIRAVAMITRHGARYPIITYPGDQNKEYLDKNGYGVLTPRGIAQMYQLGRKLKLTFPEVASKKFTHLRSSNRERCIESILLVNLGIEGPVRNLSAASFPHVTTVDPSLDPMLNHGGLTCPVREEEINNDVTINTFPQTFPELWANMSRMTGEIYNETNAFFVADVRIDPALSALLMDLPIDWADSHSLETMARVHDSWVWTMSQYEISKKLSGVFYKEIIDQFSTALTRDGLSFFGYATHDTTLGPIMVHLGLWPGHRPLYAESLIFILRANGQLEFYVSDEQLNIHKKSTPICPSDPCTLSSFEDGVKYMIPSDWRKECGHMSLYNRVYQWFRSLLQ